MQFQMPASTSNFNGYGTQMQYVPPLQPDMGINHFNQSLQCQNMLPRQQEVKFHNN